MKKCINQERIEGRVYEHKLALKTVQNQQSANFGKEFISGSLDVCTDEEGLNVVTTYFTYVTPTTSKGTNETYTNLMNIINNGKTWIENGKDAATKVRIDTSLAVNDFYNDQDQLVSTKRNEGGFVRIVSELCDENERNTFRTDMLITGTTLMEANEETDSSEHLVVKGAVFNFRNELLPVDFVVRNPDGIKYFDSLAASTSEPVFTNVRGKIVSNSIKKPVVEESAFGGSSVRMVERKVKEWLITSAAPVPYDFGDEKVLTPEELQTKIQDRQVKLADIKKRADEYKAQKNAAPSGNAFAAAPANSFAAAATAPVNKVSMGTYTF